MTTKLCVWRPPKIVCSFFNQVIFSAFHSCHTLFCLRRTKHTFSGCNVDFEVSPDVSIHHCQSPFILISSIPQWCVGTVTLTFMKLLDWKLYLSCSVSITHRISSPFFKSHSPRSVQKCIQKFIGSSYKLVAVWVNQIKWVSSKVAVFSVQLQPPLQLNTLRENTEGISCRKDSYFGSYPLDMTDSNCSSLKLTLDKLRNTVLQRMRTVDHFAKLVSGFIRAPDFYLF